MVDTIQTGKPIDFSIMPSFRCNLHCWFCMYDAGPDNQHVLDFDKTRAFLATFDWTQVNAFGFYGGEPSIATPLYDRFMALLPSDLPRFVITNGTWTQSNVETLAFLKWCGRQRLHIIVSGTPEHVQHQNRPFLENLAKEFAGVIELKASDQIHSQGRAANFDWIPKDCGLTCQRKDRNNRLGLKPDGNVVYQNCHGEYHVVQTYEQPFLGMLQRALSIRDNCYAQRVSCVKDAL